ncbi:FecR family protein [Halalkalibaculum sp. DA384]|uniref:FecR family protein n=1 Tax=Halalkalibaculum sp. DA384 TaxID=3373606 RepID=UPI00375407DA
MNWNILHKYLQGTCSEEELQALGDWLRDDPANEDFFSSFVEEWSTESTVDFEEDARAEWIRFQENTFQPQPGLEREYALNPSNARGRVNGKPYKPVNRQRRRGRAYWIYSAAAAVLLVAALVFVVQQFNAESTLEQEQQITYQEINTVKGQRTSLKLSDGSSVVLNASSTLRIPQDYGRETRTLYLEGEAFFEVEHDENNPFVVISHQTYTKDLGTAFNVTAYDSTQVEVAVEEGLVSLGKMEEDTPQKEIVEITPNKLGILKEVGGLTVSDINDMDQYTGWTRGRLVFNSTPFPEVLDRLERWYDIECIIEEDAEELSDRTLTATYDNMPMSEVLKVLSISMDVSYSREGRTIIFTKGNDLGEYEQVNTN